MKLLWIPAFAGMTAKHEEWVLDQVRDDVQRKRCGAKRIAIQVLRENGEKGVRIARSMLHVPFAVRAYLLIRIAPLE